VCFTSSFLWVQKEYELPGPEEDCIRYSDSKRRHLCAAWGTGVSKELKWTATVHETVCMEQPQYLKRQCSSCKKYVTRLFLRVNPVSVANDQSDPAVGE
jgi:hypothetical protein